MTLIQVDCKDQDLTLLDAPLITSGDVQSDEVHFTFCPKWDGMIKTAVFYRNEGETYSVLVDEDNNCIIPQEVLKEEGTFYFGVFGIKDNSVKTSEILRYKVKKGAITEGTKIPDPTPDIYSQILAKIDEAGILFTRATEEEIASILGSGAEGTGVVTVSRLNQYHSGIRNSLNDINSRIDEIMVETETAYEYGGI